MPRLVYTITNVCGPKAWIIPCWFNFFLTWGVGRLGHIIFIRLNVTHLPTDFNCFRFSVKSAVGIWCEILKIPIVFICIITFSFVILMFISFFLKWLCCEKCNRYMMWNHKYNHLFMFIIIFSFFLNQGRRNYDVKSAVCIWCGILNLLICVAHDAIYN